MLRTNQSFDEVQVYEGVAERTGTTVARDALRGCRTVCRSMTELTGKARRMGDGHFYLAAAAWPADQSRVVLTTVWTPMA